MKIADVRPSERRRFTGPFGSRRPPAATRTGLGVASAPAGDHCIDSGSRRQRAPGLATLTEWIPGNEYRTSCQLRPASGLTNRCPVVVPT